MRVHYLQINSKTSQLGDTGANRHGEERGIGASHFN